MGWRADARAVIRKYPELKQKWEESHQPAVIANYEGVAVQHGASRTTENVALRSGLSPWEEMQMEAVERAISTTRRYQSASARIKLVEYVFWKQKGNLIGAANELHISMETAKRWNNAFTELVDAYLR